MKLALEHMRYRYTGSVSSKGHYVQVYLPTAGTTQEFRYVVWQDLFHMQEVIGVNKNSPDEICSFIISNFKYKDEEFLL